MARYFRPAMSVSSAADRSSRSPGCSSLELTSGRGHGGPAAGDSITESQSQTTEYLNRATETLNQTEESLNRTTESLNPSTESLNPSAESLNPSAESPNPLTESLNPSTEPLRASEYRNSISVTKNSDIRKSVAFESFKTASPITQFDRISGVELDSSSTESPYNNVSVFNIDNEDATEPLNYAEKSNLEKHEKCLHFSHNAVENTSDFSPEKTKSEEVRPMRNTDTDIEFADNSSVLRNLDNRFNIANTYANYSQRSCASACSIDKESFGFSRLSSVDSLALMEFSSQDSLVSAITPSQTSQADEETDSQCTKENRSDGIISQSCEIDIGIVNYKSRSLSETKLQEKKIELCTSDTGRSPKLSLGSRLLSQISSPMQLDLSSSSSPYFSKTPSLHQKVSLVPMKGSSIINLNFRNNTNNIHRYFPSVSLYLHLFTILNIYTLNIFYCFKFLYEILYIIITVLIAFFMHVVAS